MADNRMTGLMWKMPTVTRLRVLGIRLKHSLAPTLEDRAQDIGEELINLPFHSSLTRNTTFRGPKAPSSKGRRDENAVLGSARW